jgi:hypothetical protein
VPWTTHQRAEVPEGYYTVPLGRAAVVREGGAVTVLVYGTMVHVALAAAEGSGIDAEIVDLRTLLPLDIDTISAPSWRRWCRSTVFIIWKRRSSASPAGTHPTRMPSNGNISRDRSGSPTACAAPWRGEVRLRWAAMSSNCPISARA